MGDTVKADKIIVSNRILTMSEAGPKQVDFVAIKDDRIIGIGGLSELDNYKAEGTQILDFGDRVVMPGFIDAHCHLEVVARTSYKHVDVRAPKFKSIAEVLATLRAAIPERLFDGWLLAQGNLVFDQKLEDKRYPTLAELDSVSRDIPLAMQCGGHVTLLNSKALEVSGIDRDYVPPAYSVMGKCIVVRDANGDATGMVKEMDAVLPMPRVAGQVLQDALVATANDQFLRYGVTAIGEISETVEGLNAMSELQRSKKFNLRVGAHLWVPGTMTLEQACNWEDHIKPQTGPEWFEVQAVKIFTDGGLSSNNAAMNRPYVTHPERSHGDLGMTKEEIRDAYVAARAAGLSLACHAVGERAAETICEAVIEVGEPREARSVRIEHAGNYLPDYERTTGLMREANVRPCPQTVFLYTLGDYFELYLGEDGKKGRFPFKRMLADGWPVCGSSDAFAGSELDATNPFFGIWCAVKRQTYKGSIIDPDEAVSIEQGLYMYTMGSAKIMAQDHDRGSLDTGKLADFIVLDRDPTKQTADGLLDIKVDEVFVGGRQVYLRA
jgi:predicted amidohydrolase YtcJ